MMKATKRTQTKKDQTLELWESGMHDIWAIAQMTETRPSYVASVLQNEGRITGYFDLYTTTESEMNIYSQPFRGRLGFKDEAAAERSVRLIHALYAKFDAARDRAGQHHCLVLAMTMFNRARCTGKFREAEVFRRWLMQRLMEASAPVGHREPRPNTVSA
jgi:hypothetical protein